VVGAPSQSGGGADIRGYRRPQKWLFQATTSAGHERADSRRTLPAVPYGDDLAWRIKLKQARKHLATLEREVEEYARHSQARFEHIYDAERNQFAAVLRADHAPPLSIGASIGDVLHNLRSSLDNITWHIVTNFTPRPEDPLKIYFPITQEGPSFDIDAPKRLPGVPAEVVEVFRQLQPWYWRVQARGLLGAKKVPKKGDQADVRREPLSVLSRLSNVDKHRTIHALTVYGGDLHWIGVPDGGGAAALAGEPPPWKSGNVVLRWQLAIGADASAYDPHGEVVIAFEQGNPDNAASVVDVLNRLVWAVGHTLAQLEHEVLKPFPPERMDEVARLHRDSQDAELRYSEHVSRFAGWGDVLPEAHTEKTLAQSARLRADAREKRQAWQEAARNLYGDW
jgi:hypothetical protein